VVAALRARADTDTRLHRAGLPFYARQFTERLVQAVERLPSMPRSGRMVPEAGFQDTIREVIYRGYRLIYRIHSEQLLQIVTVVHGARDLNHMTPPPWEPPPPQKP